MLIPLEHGQPIRFGEDGEKGVAMGADGPTIVDVADVGVDASLVHDETRADPSLAFSLSRLAAGPTEVTPIGVFRAVEFPEYSEEVSRQIAAAQEQHGPGDLHDLLRSAGTWEVS